MTSQTQSAPSQPVRPTDDPQDSPAIIDGKPIWADDVMEVHSPFDGRLLSRVPKCDESVVDHAVAVARRRLEGAPIPLHERASILDRVATVLLDRIDEFAASISAEACKPISAARTEALRAVDTIRFSAAAARSLAGEMVPMGASQSGADRIGFTLRVPIGVVACISPFNFPLNLVCHKIAPGVAAGVPMVLKPASATPLTALRIARLFEECGLPPGWINVVTTPGRTAQHLVEHPDVAMVTFTGSAEVGWNLRAAAPRKKVGLELGNSSPVIVEADADLELAAMSIVRGGFGYSGQTCISVQRVIVGESVHDELLERVATLAASIGVGDPADENTTVSSLIDHDAAVRVRAWVNEAIESGAECILGDPAAAPTSPDRPIDGSSPSAGDAPALHRPDSHRPGPVPLNLVAPTILDAVSPDMRVSCDEVFGPVIGFSRYHSLDDAIRLANATRYGLQAGVFTTSIPTAMEAARRLNFGGVIINDTSSFRADQMPYGGVKDSGNTREGPAHAVAEMTETRTIVIR